MTIYQFLMGSQDEETIMSLTMPGEAKPFTKVTKGVADYLEDSVAARTVSSYTIVNPTRIDVVLGETQEISGGGEPMVDDGDEIDDDV